MCLAMNPDKLEPGERCASTSNRNFEGRQGRGGRTHLVSPAMAAAAAIAGHIADVRGLSEIPGMEAFTTPEPGSPPAADGQRRHRPDHPQAVPEDDRARRAWAGLFYDLRFDAEGRREARLRAEPAGLQGADPGGRRQFRLRLVSREHAPWALLDFGVRCVIAPSFADIFYNNCFKNGMLPIVLPEEEVDELMDEAERGANAIVCVDLETQVITGPDGARSRSRSIRSARRAC